MIIPVYKPPGLSSYDVIRKFKKETGFKGKIGHAGTLDPFAEGLLILLTDKDTKRFEEFQKYPKTYLAGVKLGEKSNTLDVEGKIEKGRLRKLKREEIESALKKFTGKLKQKVPEFSAVKHKGKPLYKLAKQGKAPIKEKEVEVYSAKLIAFKNPLVTLEFTVSSGTYIRQLTYDIFDSLGVDSFLYFLKRTKIGKYEIEITNFQ